ncbi:MAG TPA: VOC family protein [Acidimicrobiales bacterium]|nr:VOC family protein [Acidimicrobiales bacterium]
MPAPLATPGPLHRIGLAVGDADAAAAWFSRVLGAAPFATLSSSTGTDGDPDGSYMRMLALAGQPFLLMSPSTDEGFAAAFLRRYGPAVHSLAWEIEDLWGTEHRLALRGIRITGVSIEGRHFFMHPKDTFGLLMEWTDDRVDNFGSGVPTIGEIGVPVPEVAWVAAVVEDVEAAARFLGELGGARPLEGLPAAHGTADQTIDLSMGPVPLRLVTPRSEESPYSLARGPRWFSVCLRVPDLAAALGGLERAGCPVVREGEVAWTDPAATAGLQLQWTSWA